jgi:hypothetical protein
MQMMKGFIALVSTSYNCSNKIITSLNTYLLNELKSFTSFTIYNKLFLKIFVGVSMLT